MMEAARTSETLVNFYQTTRRYNPEDGNLQSYETVTSEKEKVSYIGYLQKNNRSRHNIIYPDRLLIIFIALSAAYRK
jgi:hypothetical protein